MIVIGGSLGGMKALCVLLRALPPVFPDAVAVVLHRLRDADEALVRLLGRECALPVVEPADKEPICPGRVYLGPPDYHLLAEPENFSLSTDDPVQYARPSVDLLFESAADSFGPSVIAIVLSGANRDGARGAARVREKGGRVVVQDPATAESPVMPLAALEAAGTGTRISTLEQMGPLLLQWVRSASPS